MSKTFLGSLPSNSPVPSTYDVPIKLRVLQVASFECVDLPLQVGKRVGNLRAFLHEFGKLVPCITHLTLGHPARRIENIGDYFRVK